MNPIYVALLGMIAPSLLCVFLYALVSKSKQTAEAVFEDQISGALAKWETEFRKRLAEEAAEHPDVQLSARDWLNIIAAIEKTFNGRYFLAPEGRALIAELRVYFDQHQEKLHDRISKMREEIRGEILQRLEDGRQS